jgi:hypothetical protein
MGIDVFFFNERHRAYTMIQYKAMKIQGKGQSVHNSTTQLLEEIRRMHVVRDIIRKRCGVSFNAPSGYRLHDSPFFFKFVPHIVFEAGSKEMLPGLFIPSDYCLYVMEKWGQVTGAERHLSNTDFIQLVRGGWIGTTDLGTKIIEEEMGEVVAQSRKSGNVTWLASIASYGASDPSDESEP